MPVGVVCTKMDDPTQSEVIEGTNEVGVSVGVKWPFVLVVGGSTMAVPLFR